MNKRHQRFFRYAEQISNLSDCRCRIGSILVVGNRILATGFNDPIKTSPLQKKYSHLRGFGYATQNPCIHSEIALLSKVKHLDFDKRKAVVYIFRRDKSGSISTCKPCPACEAALRDFGIRRVFYTTNSGIQEMELK